MNIYFRNIVYVIMNIVEVLFFYNIFVERKMNNKIFFSVMLIY